MNDIKFDILNKSVASNSELDRIMQTHIDSGQFTREELAEIRKREANKLKQVKVNEEKVAKQKEQETSKATTIAEKMLESKANYEQNISQEERQRRSDEMFSIKERRTASGEVVKGSKGALYAQQSQDIIKSLVTDKTEREEIVEGIGNVVDNTASSLYNTFTKTIPAEISRAYKNVAFSDLYDEEELNYLKTLDPNATYEEPSGEPTGFKTNADRIKYLEGYKNTSVGKEEEKINKFVAEKYKEIDVYNKYLRKDTGEGIVKGVKQGDASDVVLGVFNAGAGMVETIVPSMVTGGWSLPFQITAPMLMDYNQQKAERIYGKDDPDAVLKLLQNKEDETAVPGALGLLASGFEYIGYKGITNYMLGKAAKGTTAKLLLTGNKEGVTELGQSGIEEVNMALAQGKEGLDVGKAFIDGVFSEKGLESYLQGFIGGTGMSAGGRAVNRALRSNNASVKELNGLINNLSELNVAKNSAKNTTAKEAIEVEIKESEQNLKKYITDRRKIADILNEDQKQNLINAINEKDNITSKAESLKTQLNNNEISSKEFGYAIRGLNNQNKRLIEQIELINETAKQQLLQTSLETTKEEAGKLGLEQVELSQAEFAKLFPDDADSDGAIQGNKIYINRDVARETGAIGVGSHELLHGIIGNSYQKLGKEEKIKLNTEFLNLLGAKEKQTILNRLASSYGITGDKVFETEELFTAFSDEIVDGGLSFNEGVFGKIKNTVHKVLNKLGYKKEFESARQTYNFLKDYSKNIKKGKLTERAAEFAKEDPGVEGERFSKVYQEVEAMKPDLISTDPATKKNAALIAANTLENEVDRRLPKLENVNKEAREDIVRDFLFSEGRGLTGLLTKYDPNINESIMGYLNSFVPGTKMSLLDARLQEFYKDDPRFGNIVQSMEQEGVTEKVEQQAAEETVVKSETETKKKKIVLADRLGINDKVSKAINKIVPSLELDKLNFKTLKNKIPEITGELFGISPKKIVSGANITKGELQSAQMFINKNADVLIAMLPEGATVSGTATGVPQTLLKAFYTKTGRAKMAKTGTRAGLAVQVKNDNISKNDFLEVFGIVNGIPSRTDRNTSARVLALANQTGKMITNQAVRQEIGQATTKAKETIDRLKDGKSKVMFSKTNFKSIYENKVGDLSEALGYKLCPKKTAYRINSKGKRVPYQTRDLDAKFNKKETYRDAGVRVINTFLESHPQFRELIKITMTGGEQAGFFQTVPNFNNLINKTDVEQSYIGRTKYGGKGGVYDINHYNKLKKGELNEDNNKRLPLLLEFYEAIGAHLQNFPDDIVIFEEMLLDTGRQQNVFTRILAPFAFYPINPKTGKPIFNQKIAEEHTDPQNLIGKAMLSGALFGNLDQVWKVVGKSYMQGAILNSAQNPHDKTINSAGYQRSMPDVYYEKIVPRLISGELNLPNGYSSIVRLAAAGIDLNMYYLTEADMSIAKFFKVDNIKDTKKQNELIIQQLSGEVTADYAENISKIPFSEDIDNGKIVNKAINNARSSNFSKSNKGISILDFDDTLATTKSLVKYTTPDGKTGTLNAEEFASTYEDLQDQGYTFDFSDFNKVVKGKLAPLFNKALKLQKKFGPENMFVLTARPPAAQKAIFDFLKANGLNIPLKNITGLGNSTAEAKALWIADKVGDGYNDFYFADDALQNVQAVKNMLDQFDVKSKVQQAKVNFSKSMDTDFNDILEKTTGIESKKEFSTAQAQLRGKSSKYKSIIPPSAQDFMGLIYNFLGKGKQGDADLAFFKKALVDPFARGVNELNTSRQRAANDLENLNKKLPEVKKRLYKKIKGTDYTNDQAMRVYLWNKAGFEIPGISKRDLKTLVETVENDPKLKAYAEAASLISKQDNVYREPKEYWLAENIASDLLDDGAVGDARSTFIAEWIENKNIIFSLKNLNKIEAIYGSKFREALEDVLYAMETGRSRPRGGGRLVNAYTNWVNNSVGAIMFFNMRSALLQTISATNYINWSDNNPLKAAATFANQPQYWKDFAFIFNSDYLKQRRSGNRRGVNEQELSAAVAGSDNKAKAAIAWLLSKGFLPTQIADSFAIASGGATFYRNRIKKYIKEGLTQEQAQEKAFLDFQEITEVSQQSARPDMISQQQRSPLGRLILAFANTPMQYSRIMNKAARDLVNGRGDNKTHISKIVYYGFVQSIIFSALQSALFASLGDEDEDDFDKKKERILNQISDSVLTGIGFGGKAIITVKNTIITFLDQRDRGFRADHAYTLLQLLSFSPPIGSKLRKVYSSIKTDQYNKDVYMRRGFTLDNPIWQAIGNVVEGITNVPLGRMSNKMLNIDNALDESNKWWQRAALILGWNTWDLGIRDPDIEEIKQDIKKEKKQISKIKSDKKKEEQRIEKQEEQKALIQENIKKSKKDGICAAISRSGNRCRKDVEPGSSYCTIHVKVTQNKTGKKVQCKKTKSNGKRCKMKTSSASGYCYYHD